MSRLRRGCEYKIRHSALDICHFEVDQFKGKRSVYELPHSVPSAQGPPTDTRGPKYSTRPHTNTMFSMVPRRGGAFGSGPRITPKLGSAARAVGSIPRLQAQVADISKEFSNGEGGILPLLNRMPVREAASIVRPVATAVSQNRDEFWRKVPLWENVSAGDFLSYRWSVSHPALTHRVNQNLFLLNLGRKHGSRYPQAPEVSASRCSRDGAVRQVRHKDADS